MEHYLGEKLKSLRESRNWTQADLAKRLNKAVSTISGYESDAHAIPLDVLASISLLFGISTDELSAFPPMSSLILKQVSHFHYQALLLHSKLSLKICAGNS